MPELIWAPFSCNKRVLLRSVKSTHKAFVLHVGAAQVFGMGQKHLLLFRQHCTAVEFQMNLRKVATLFIAPRPQIYERWSHVWTVFFYVCVWWLALVFVIGCIAHDQQSIETAKFHILDYHLIAFFCCCDIRSLSTSCTLIDVAIQWNINS